MERITARRRPGRPQREIGGIEQRPWKQLTRPYRADRDPVGRPGPDDPRDGPHHPRGDRHAGAAAAGAPALSRAPAAMSTKARCGCASTAPWSMERIAKAPSSFELRARNPAKNVKVGGRHCILSSVGGPAYVMDNDRGRRPGTYAEMCDYLKLIQSFNVLHQEGGGPFEPLDLHQNTRHLDLYYAEITLLDKNWQPQTLGTRTRHRRAGNGGDLARHDAREAGSGDAGLHRHHQHQFAAAARRADGRRADRRWPSMARSMSSRRSRWPAR